MDNDATIKTVVITGASSGIGRITAQRLAAKGYNLALAARNAAALETVAKECRKLSARIIVQKTDVTKRKAVEQLAAVTCDTFGSIDVWFNNAGVSQVGRFMDVPADDFNRVIETNLLGVVNGSRAALQVFYKQEYGTLINMSSVLGVVPDPYESAYVASKFAIRGFTASLRQELSLDGLQNVHACTVMPASMNTPIYDNAANATGKVISLIPPVYPAEMVAEAVLKLIDIPQREVVVGKAGAALITAGSTMPASFEKTFARYIRRFHFKKGRDSNGPGNLYKQSNNPRTHGWQKAVPKQTDALAVSMLAVGVATLLYKLRKAR